MALRTSFVEALCTVALYLLSQLLKHIDMYRIVSDHNDFLSSWFALVD